VSSLSEPGGWTVPPSGRWRIRASHALLPGRGLVSDYVVTVDGAVVTAVAAAADPGPGSSGAEPGPIIDATGYTLLPGLIDAHTHLMFPGGRDPVPTIKTESEHAMVVRALGNAQDALMRGVTTLVDCGSKGSTMLSLRDAIDAGLVVAPRLLAAGRPITTTAGHCHWLGGQADSFDDVIRQARTLAAEGVDFLKLMLTGGNMTALSNTGQLQYPEETVRALGAEARRIGIPLVVHAHTEGACRLAAESGARIIAHATCATGDAIGLSDQTLAALVESQCYVDPTLMVGVSPNHSLERKLIRAQMLPLFRRMHDAGVPLLAGTDGGSTNVGHADVAGSVASLLNEVGLSLEECLASATELPARALGRRHQIGAIEAGLSADFTVVPGDLHDDISALYRPRAVYLKGRLVASEGHLLASVSPAASVDGMLRVNSTMRGAVHA
jgi:imidazolonepropionase-like amidohydrolase